MAYRRRQGITRASTFKEEIHYSSPSHENHDDFTSSSSSSASSSLAAQAIRASAAHRESSLSSAYGGSALASRDRDSEAHRSKSFAAYGGSSVTNESKSGFWGVLARKAKAILEEENISEEFEKPNRMKPLADDSSTQGQFSEGFRRMDNPTLRKGLDRITSSLNQIGDTFEKAFEEGRTIVENKTADIKQQIRRKGNASDAQNQAPGMNSSWGQQAQPLNQINHETQLKASRDVAMATAAKAKLLLRELKTVKADLAFAKLRCSQLEEENKILREGKEKGGNAADDDLIRLQLETLLAEKSRLANENATYARENRFLREIVEYHQLTMQDVVYLDEGIEEVTEVYPIVYPNVSSFLAMSPTSPKSPTSVVDMPTSNSHSSTRDILNLKRVPEENNDGSAMEILNLKGVPEVNNDGSGNGAPEDSDAPDVKEEDVRGSVTSSP